MWLSHCQTGQTILGKMGRGADCHWPAKAPVQPQASPSKDSWVEGDWKDHAWLGSTLKESASRVDLAEKRDQADLDRAPAGLIPWKVADSGQAERHPP